MLWETLGTNKFWWQESYLSIFTCQVAIPFLESVFAIYLAPTPVFYLQLVQTSTMNVGRTSLASPVLAGPLFQIFFS